MAKNFLFVCSANKQRSKTGEDYFSTFYPQLHFLSCGTNIKICRKEGTTPLSETLLLWADTIFVMEKKHLQAIAKFSNSPVTKKVIVLAVEDKYKYYQKELIEILHKKISQHLN